MNESQVRNLTPDELLNAFECGQLTDENIKQAFGVIAGKLNDVLHEAEDAENELTKAEAELDDTNKRAGELENAIREALEMNDIDDLKDHLKGIL